MSVTEEEKIRFALERFMILAHHEFLDHESNMGRNQTAAVRAGQLCNYIHSNLSNSANFESYQSIITPDFCEKYLQEHFYVTQRDDSAVELNAKQRANKAHNAYSEFRDDIGFQGTKADEIRTFQDYVKHKYPWTLADFYQNEAEAVMKSTKKKRIMGEIATVAAATAIGLGSLIGVRNKINDSDPLPDTSQHVDTYPQQSAPSSASEAPPITLSDSNGPVHNALQDDDKPKTTFQKRYGNQEPPEFKPGR